MPDVLANFFMIIFTNISAYFVTGPASVSAEAQAEDKTVLPSFISSSKSFEVKERDAVVLPCEIRNKGKSELKLLDFIHMQVKQWIVYNGQVSRRGIFS